jgi:hypothetical protein
MKAPPLAQVGDDGWDEGDVTVFAAFAVANVEAGMVGFGFVEVAPFDANGFTDAQAAMIDELQAGLETGFANGGQDAGDVLP